MGIDNGILARIRRSGLGGQAAQDTQRIDDIKARGYTDEDAARGYYTKLKEQQLHDLAEKSHAAHRDATGQVPKED